MNTLSGVAGSGVNNSLLTQKLTDAKQQYKKLSTEEQNSVQNNALDKKNEVAESRTEKQDQLRGAAVQVYSNQQAKENAELFISLSTGQDIEAGQTLSASAASNVYKSVQTNTLVNNDVFQNNTKTQSTGVDTAQNQTLSASAASNVYQAIQGDSLSSGDVFRNDRNQQPDVQTASLNAVV